MTAALVPLVLALAWGAPPADEEDAPRGPDVPPLPAAEDVADVPALDVVLDGDANRRYVLIGVAFEGDEPPEGAKRKRKFHDPRGTPPGEGYGLVFVMPGGSGSIDFHPFVKRIHRHAVPDGFLTVQLVAPRFDRKQVEEHVWPTEGHPWPGQPFACDDFVLDVLKDVQRRVDVDERRIFSLAWSSSGTLAYALSLRKKTPFTGTFVAMSVFRREWLPLLSGARGHAYYLLHSPEDFIDIANAERAAKELAEKKAAVEFVTYEGGHVWPRDVYPSIRTGLEWLEKEAANRKRR